MVDSFEDFVALKVRRLERDRGAGVTQSKAKSKTKRSRSKAKQPSDSEQHKQSDSEQHKQSESQKLKAQGNISSANRIAPTKEMGKDSLKPQSSNHFNACAVKGNQVNCEPAKQQILQDVIDQIEDKDQQPVIDTLNKLGVRVYVIEHNTDDLFSDIKYVIEDVSNIDRRHAVDSEFMRCLLYRDSGGRLYNLLLKKWSGGAPSSWRNQLYTFSGFQATIAMTILTRSFPCAGSMSGVKPAYLGFILGIVLSEEMSYAWVTAVMLVWGMPSISAYNFLYPMASDLPRKLTVFILTVSSVVPDSINRTIVTLTGVAMACAILAANLGSRAWYNLKMRPLAYDGPGASILAFFAAMITGICVPYMGYHEVEAGGKVALEVILRSALFVAIFFVLSDFDYVQRFFIAGSETCNQDIVNIAVGIWFTITLLLCMFLCKRIAKYQPNFLNDEPPIVVSNEDSPVGYIVPNIPDFPINTVLFAQPNKRCPLKFEIILGIIMAFGIGAAILFMGFTDADDKVTSKNYN